MEDLSDWDGQTHHDGFDRLVASLAALVPPMTAMILSLEQDRSAADFRSTNNPPTSGVSENPQRQAYRVRLEGVEQSHPRSEAVTIVDDATFRFGLQQIVGLLDKVTITERADVQLMERLGMTWGEDILQDLGLTLGDAARRAKSNSHLQLEIPRELMPYPWELMQHSRGWLCEDFALGRVSLRARAPKTRTRLSGPLRVLIVANPTSEQRPHPYAAQEARAVVETLGKLAAETDGLLDFSAMRDAVINRSVTKVDLRNRLRVGHYDIVHFSGYGAFNAERPELGAWMLSDGPLSTTAISNTWHWTEDQPWLVYASVSDSGFDGTQQNQEVRAFGLANAFLDAGVTACVVPLWRIDDMVGAEFARIFYEQVLKERQTVGESLRRAKVQVKRKYYDPALQAGESASAAHKGLSSSTLLSWLGSVLYGDPRADMRQRLALPVPSASAGGDHH